MSTTCLVENFSNTGACVVFPEGVMIPRYFSLTINPDTRAYAARVVWQRASVVGVVLLNPRANAPEIIAG